MRIINFNTSVNILVIVNVSEIKILDVLQLCLIEKNIGPLCNIFLDSAYTKDFFLLFCDYMNNKVEVIELLDP